MKPSARHYDLEPLEHRRLLSTWSPNVSIDFTKPQQTITGLGAAMIGWKNMPEYQNPAFFDQVVNDLGGTVVRIPIWPTFENVNDNGDPATIDWSKFDSNAIAPHMRFLQEMKKRGATTFFATLWSPPHWMKTNGNYNEGGHVPLQMLDELGEFMSAFVIAAKRDFGIDFAAVSIQNEPYFFEPYESAVYDPNRYADAIAAVQSSFARHNLSSTRLLVTEDLGYARRLDWWLDPLFTHPRIDKSKLILAHHWSSPDDARVLAERSAQYGVPVWFTEVSGKPDNWENAMLNIEEINNFLVLGNASVFTYWQYSDSLATSSLMTNGVPNNKYWSFRHIAHWVAPGAQRLATTSDQARLGISAYRHPQTGAQTIVLYNRRPDSPALVKLKITGQVASSFQVFQSTEAAKNVSLGTVAAGGDFQVTLPPYSMVTLHNGPAKTVTTATTALPPQTFQFRADPASTDALRREALHGNLAGVQARATSGNVSNAFANGMAAMHNAAVSPYSDAPAIIAHLASLGGSVTRADEQGRTPLHFAAANPLTRWQVPIERIAERMQALLSRGANVNARDVYGRTPLHYAAMQPRWNITTPLDRVVQDALAVQTLLAAGADPNAIDLAGKKPIEYASAAKNEAAVRVLQGLAPDTTPPVLTSVDLRVAAQPKIRLRFNDDVFPSINAHDVTLTHVASGATRGWRDFTLRVVSASRSGTEAVLTLRQPLTPGEWRVSLPVNAVYDRSWNRLAADTSFTVRTYVPGDMNGDGVVNNQDIAPFVLALTDPAGFASDNPTLDFEMIGDVDGDFVFNNQDIAAFVAMLTGSRPAAWAGPAATPAKPVATSPTTRGSAPLAATPLAATPFARTPVRDLLGDDGEAFASDVLKVR